jgi:hypothetical protein
MTGLYYLITVNSRHYRTHSAELHWTDNDMELMHLPLPKQYVMIIERI